MLARAHHLATDRWGDEEQVLPRSHAVELRVALKCKSSGHPPTARLAGFLRRQMRDWGGHEARLDSRVGCVGYAQQPRTFEWGHAQCPS